MIILHVITDLDRGGAETMLFNICSHSPNTYSSIEILSLSPCGNLTHKFNKININVIELDLNLTHLTNIKQLFQALIYYIKINPDIIVGWMYHGCIAALLLSKIMLFKLNRCRLYWTIRQSLYNIENEKKRTKNIINILSFLSFAPIKIIYNSVLSSNQHMQLGFRKNKTVIIPNGFDQIKYFPNLYQRKKLRSLMKLNGKIVVGNISRYHPMKDHETLLKSVSLIVEKNTNVVLLLAGKNLDYNNHKLVNQIKRSNLINNILLLGMRSDIHYLLSAIDVTVVSSSWGEGFPNIIGESMLCGVPCVVTNVGDSANIVGDTGVVCMPNNHYDLASSILIIIQKISKKSVKKEISVKTRQRVIDNYSIEYITNRYTNTFI